MTITVKFPDSDTYNLSGIHQKQNYCHASYKAIDSDFKTLVDVRFYWSPKHSETKLVYCCFWADGVGDDGLIKSYSGSGIAGGAGYHKTSAALEFALDSAGIGLSVAISGVGDSAIYGAALAIAERLTTAEKVVIIKGSA